MRADRVAGLALLGASVWFGAVALGRYTYWGSTGPGSGFLPVWLSAAMAALAALLVARADGGPAPLPRGRGLARLVAVVAATAAFIALLPWAGMTVTTVLFLLALLRGLERYPWPLAGGVAVATAAVNHLVFTYWLRVPFPTGVLGF